MVDKKILSYLETIKPSFWNQSPDWRDIKLRHILDSLDMLEFIAYLENTFAIKIKDQDVVSRNFETVDSTINFVNRMCQRD